MESQEEKRENINRLIGWINEALDKPSTRIEKVEGGLSHGLVDVADETIHTVSRHAYTGRNEAVLIVRWYDPERNNAVKKFKETQEIIDKKGE